MVATQADRAAVRRLWYRLYVEQRGVLREKADHQLRELDDPLLCAGHVISAWRGAEVVGTLMTTFARDVALPRDYVEFYRLQEFPSYPEAVAITTKFMVLPQYRGSPLASRLLRENFRLTWTSGIDACVFDTNPPLDKLFERLGARRAGPPQFHPDFGEVVVMQLLRKDAAVFGQPGHPFSDVLCAAEPVHV